MSHEIILEHVLGAFIFKQDGTLIANGETAAMRAKYPDAQSPTIDDLPRILPALRQQGLRAKLAESNIKATRLAIASSVNQDNFIIQATSCLEETQKTANLHSKRLREWYGLFVPELSRATPDHETFAKKILERTPAQIISEDNVTHPMGNPNFDEEVIAAQALARLVLEEYNLVRTHTAHLEHIMQSYCPNVLALTGATIAGKLISNVGGLKRLSQLPSSTIQLIGAEKALFRHLRNKQIRPPKHGYILSHPLLSKAPREKRGKVARALADKISIAAKVDYFKGAFIGDSLRTQLEAKFP